MRPVDADEAKRIAREYLTDPYHVISAVAVLDKTPTLTQPNELLTIEQLREMDGEPVWIDDEKTWALLQVWDGDNIDAVFPMPRGCFHAENVIGKKIFRRPPEGEADD